MRRSRSRRGCGRGRGRTSTASSAVPVLDGVAKAFTNSDRFVT